MINPLLDEPITASRTSDRKAIAPTGQISRIRGRIDKTCRRRTSDGKIDWRPKVVNKRCGRRLCLRLDVADNGHDCNCYCSPQGKKGKEAHSFPTDPCPCLSRLLTRFILVLHWNWP